MNSRTLILILLLPLVLIQSDLLAGPEGSIYSRFGIGLLNHRGQGRITALSGTSLAIASENLINSANPATLTFLNKTLFEGSVSFNSLQMSDQAGAAGAMFGGTLDGALVAFPIYQPLGISALFEFKPYSTVAYSTYREGISEGQNFKQTIDGTGGLNLINLSGSFKIHESFMAGASLQLIFGALKQHNSVNYLDQTYAKSDEEYYRNASGLLYQVSMFSPNLAALTGVELLGDIQAGLVLTTGGTIDSEQRNIIYTTSGSSRSPQDTSLFQKGTFEIPFSVGLGAGYKLSSRTTLSADFFYQPWGLNKFYGTEVKELLGSGSVLTLKDMYRVSAGVEIVPGREIGSALQRVSYRAGMYFEDSYIKVGETAIREFGGSIGVGIPLAVDMRMDLGLLAGVRGTTSSALIRDTIIRFTLSISSFETWFTDLEED